MWPRLLGDDALVNFQQLVFIDALTHENLVQVQSHFKFIFHRYYLFILRVPVRVALHYQFD